MDMFIYDDLRNIEEINENNELAVSPLSFEVLDCNR